MLEPGDGEGGTSRRVVRAERLARRRARQTTGATVSPAQRADSERASQGRPAQDSTTDLRAARGAERARRRAVEHRGGADSMARNWTAVRAAAQTTGTLDQARI